MEHLLTLEGLVGVTKRVELFLGRPLQWIVCLLHANELPFRHAFDYIDCGMSKGPSKLSGKIGAQLHLDLTKRSVVNFSAVTGDLPELSPDILQDLSEDHRYLYDIRHAIQKGKISCKLQQRSPGNLHNARWLTRANRVLRLYISTSNHNQRNQ